MLFRLPCLLIGLMFLALPARAELIICNDTAVQHSIAVGYKSNDNWESHGWWNIDPNDCKTVVGGDLKNRYYYYRATATGRTFNGADYYFCSLQSKFDIVGADDCAARGFDRTEFAAIDTGKSAKKFTLTLVDKNAGAATPAAPPQPAEGRTYYSGVAQGANGEPLSQRGIFQGCMEDDGAQYCAFHADGWKYYAYYGGPTPDSFLDQLWDLPPATAVHFSGDVLNYGDISVEVTLSSVTVMLDDPYQPMLAAIQGDWVSFDDRNYTASIFGAEMHEYYQGGYTGTRFMRFDRECPEMPGVGPALVLTEPETQEPLCFIVNRADSGGFNIGLIGSPNPLDFRRR